MSGWNMHFVLVHLILSHFTSSHLTHQYPPNYIQWDEADDWAPLLIPAESAGKMPLRDPEQKKVRPYAPSLVQTVGDSG